MTVVGLSRLLGVGEAGLGVLLASALVLLVAALARGLAQLRLPTQDTRRAWRSVGTWWTLFALLLGVLAAGRAGVWWLMVLVSFLLLRETLQLVERPRLLLPLGLAGAALHGWAWLDAESVFVHVLPPLLALLVAWELARRSVLRSAFREPPRWQYPVLIALIGPSYVFGVASLPAPASAPENEMGWFLLVVLLTELNDMAQAWWGRAFGSHPLVPRLSPGKTWEGLVGGLATTSLTALVLCPALTSYGRMHPEPMGLPAPPWIWSLAVGFTVGVVGLGGDLSASALKRKAGVKDAGTLLPGHGGVLDRFDSLAATGPFFFLLTYLLWNPNP